MHYDFFGEDVYVVKQILMPAFCKIILYPRLKNENAVVC